MTASDDALRQLHSQQLAASEIAQRAGLPRAAVLARLRELRLLPWPEPSSPSRDAAQAFHRLAVAHLGEGTTQAEIARILGVAPSQYSMLLTGKRESLDSVAAWLAAWRAAGHPALALRVEVVPLEQGPPVASVRPARKRAAR